MNKKEVLRKCIACHEQKDKNELIRIVRDKDKNLSIDKSGKMNGRGAYICKDNKCLDNAISKKLLNSALKTRISDEFYQEIRDYVN